MATVLAKLGSPAMLGMYTLANIVAGPVFTISNLSLRSNMITDTSHKFTFRDYFAIRLLTSALAYSCIFIFAFHSYQHMTAIVVAIVAIGTFFDSISDVVYGIFQQNLRADYISRSMILKGILNFAMMWTTMYLTRSVVWATLANSISSLVIVALYDCPTAYFLHNRGAKRDATAKIKAILSLGTFSTIPLTGKIALITLPLAISQLFVSVIGNVPQYFIQKDLGVRELGLYAAVTYLVNIGRAGIMAAGFAASPYLAKAYSQGRYLEYRNTVVKLAIISLILAVASPILAALIGRKAITILFTSEYAQRTSLIVLILFAGGLRYLTTMIGYSIGAARYFNVQLLWFGVSLLVAVCACWWFVPRMGLEGAAVAASISAVAEVIIGFIILIHALSSLRKKHNLGIGTGIDAELAQNGI
jgi:O-antigen/teichoic acid export membrane protein